MRVTIFTVGTLGDVQPYIALGRGLKAAGHTVRLATTADYALLVREHGLAFFPVAGDAYSRLSTAMGVKWVNSGRNLWRFVTLLRRLIEPGLGPSLRDLLSACKETDALIFGGAGLLGWPAIRDLVHIPAIAAYTQPYTPSRHLASAFFPTINPGLPAAGLYNRLTQILPQHLFWWLFRGTLNRLRRRLRQAPPLPWRAPLGATISPRRPTLYGFSPAVVPKPPDWPSCIHVTGYWFLDPPAEWAPPEALEAFLASGPAPVYIGFGSMANQDPAATRAVVVDALAQTRRRGVLQLAGSGLDRVALPETVFPLDFAPHAWLFPRMAAVVHHGGAGTTAAGLRAGVPSVCVPFFADQPFWARRTAQLGASPPPIPRADLTAGRLARAIAATGDPAMRARAARLGELIRAEQGVALAVRAFEQELRKAWHSD